MTAINFIHPDGRSEQIDAGDAESAMLAATTHGVEGILAECGGNAMCATCHVYVDEAWLARLPDLGEDEDALLDGTAAERRGNSRSIAACRDSDSSSFTAGRNFGSASALAVLINSPRKYRETSRIPSRLILSASSLGRW